MLSPKPSALAPPQYTDFAQARFNILFCHNHYKQRSGEDIAFDFALRLLRQAGHTVEIYTRNNSEIDDFGWRDKLLFPSRTVYSSRTKREISNVLSSRSPDVAIVQNVFPLLSPSIYRELADANVPIVQLLFNYRLLCANGLFFTKDQICERCLGGNYSHAVFNRCFRDSYFLSAIYAAALSFHRSMNTWGAVNVFVAPDEFLKGKMVEAGFDSRRIKVLSNPFDSTEYIPHYEADDYALFVGRLIRPKGIFTLLDAVLKVDNYKLLVVGDGEEVENVRNHLAVRNGKAVFLGPVYGDSLKKLIANAAFVTVPSEWYDNLPMIVCQAFAAGKPVVASRINGIPEFVKHEENGILFSAGDSTALAEAMVRLFKNPKLRFELALGARRTVDNLLSPEVWQTKMNLLLEEVINNARVPVMTE